VLSYDQIGIGYARYRQPDPRIARAIRSALADARTVVNVGAGAGSYEPSDLEVTAVEPSRAMIEQRPPGSAPVVCASAEALPFDDSSFDAALAILTVHHWTDLSAGLTELSRVARDRVVVLTHDALHARFWLIDDYFPDIAASEKHAFPSLEHVASHFADVEVRVVPVPHDCSDGFIGAYWRRPLQYLDDGTRAAISSFSRITDVEPRLARLEADVASGRWAARNAALLELRELDLGYRLLVGRGRSRA
jgi:SAM-dependent methyltransferase